MIALTHIYISDRVGISSQKLAISLFKIDFSSEGFPSLPHNSMVQLDMYAVK